MIHDMSVVPQVEEMRRLEVKVTTISDQHDVAQQ